LLENSAHITVSPDGAQPPRSNGSGTQPATGSINDLLRRSQAAVLVGAHDALGAKIAEECGADGLWISSFEVHAAHRLPDADILGTEDYVHVIAQIVDRVGIPVLVDGNAGGGNAINTIRLVREFEKAGALGMCIEDNPFPKRCSFYEGMQDQLEQADTFCGKLQAAVEKRCNPEFTVIGRVEALNKGLGIDVALERAKRYAAVGVEAILIHHKGKDAIPVLQFADEWFKTETTPLVCVPTTYNRVTYDELNDAGFKLIIFANYGIRSVVSALRSTFRAIMANKRLADADGHVASMQEIFDLVYVDELRDNEARYIR
jgi:phosphoenolpyruvate phosphomutase